MPDQENRRLIEGHRVFAATAGSVILDTRELEPASAAATSRADGTGKLTTTDGPFLETEEAVDGYYLVEGRDLDEVLGLAARLREATARRGGVEIRLVWPVKRFARSVSMLRHDDRGNVAVGFLRVLTLLAAFVAVALVAGVLAAGLVLPAAGAAGYLTRSGSDYYEDLPTDLAIPPLSQTSSMVAADGSLIATFFSENRSPTSLNRMGEWAPKAIVAIEDERFYTHGGMDIRGTLRALGNNVLGGSQQGASTLTQQYVKQVQLESAVYSGDPEELARVLAEITASGPEGYGRKLREAKLAIALEEELTKDEILERYLNIANFGNATYGIQAASQRYFSVNAEELTIQQAAMLAGVVQAPTRWDPLDNPDAALSRRNTVLFSMLSTGAITQAQYDEASASELGLAPRETQRGCITSGQLDYFCDYAEQLILDDPAYGQTRAERENLLLRGGLRIETTINPEVQALAWEAVRSEVPEGERASVAMSVVQPGTGQILAMAQNTVWGYDPEDPSQTTVNYNVDQRYNGGDPGVDGSIEGLNQFPINGRRYDEVFGSTLALPTWDAFMNSVDGAYDLGAQGFPDPENEIVGEPTGEQDAVRGSTESLTGNRSQP